MPLLIDHRCFSANVSTKAAMEENCSRTGHRITGRSQTIVILSLAASPIRSIHSSCTSLLLTLLFHFVLSTLFASSLPFLLTQCLLGTLNPRSWPRLINEQAICHLQTHPGSVPLTKCSKKYLIVTILVGRGPDARAFAVHLDHLTKSSDYFKAAMGGEWKEGDFEEISLEEDDPKVFQYYMDFLYSRGLNATKPASFDAAEGLLGGLLDAYILSDKLQDNEFGNIVMNAILVLCNTVFPGLKDGDRERYLVIDTEMISKVWSNLPKDSPPRRFVLDEGAFRPVNLDYVDEFLAESLPVDFFHEFARALMRSKLTKEINDDYLSNIKNYSRQPQPTTNNTAQQPQPSSATLTW